MSRIKLQNTYKQSARRFADHYRQFSRIHEKDYDILIGELENIFYAIGLYGDLKAWQEVVEIIQLIDGFLDTTGYWEELLAGFHISIESADNYFWMQGRDPKPETWYNRITLRIQLGTLLFRRGEYKEARAYVTEALNIARRVQNHKLEALILGELGNIAMVQGAYKESQSLLIQSKNMLGVLGDTANLTNALERLSLLARSQGHLNQAWDIQTERLSLIRKSGNQSQLAAVSVDLGNIAVALGNYDEANILFQDSMVIYTELADQQSIAWVMGFQSELLIKMGKIEEGCQLLRERIQLERKYGDRSRVLNALINLASVVLNQGNLEDSHFIYRDALELAKTLGDLTTQALCLQGLGNIQELREDNELAYCSFKESLDIALRSGYAKLIVVSYDRLSLFLRVNKKFEMANEYLLKALSFNNRLGLTREKGQILFSLGGVASMRGRLKDAYKYYEEAFAIFDQFKQIPEMGYCLTQQSLLSFSSGNVGKAWDLLTRAIEVFNSCKDIDLKDMIIRRLNDFSEIPKYQTSANQVLKSIDIS